MQPLEHVGLPQPPPWRRKEEEKKKRQTSEDRARCAPRLRFEAGDSEAESEFDLCVREWAADSRPAGAAWLTEAYRNIIPPTVYPVVLLFLELPAGEVDVNVILQKQKCASDSSA